LNIPKILAPAGDKNSFLAAIAAGADAIYCGLKIFSARMEAENFSIEELSRLTKLAHEEKIKVYIAFNSIIKESEIGKVFNILTKLVKYVDVDALIVQDLSVITLAKIAGFNKELHLSTLGNCTFPKGLDAAVQFGFNKVVIPREFNIDEIKIMAEQTPVQIDLEAFIHGALCYSVSGRCYWSSWFGGKSSLRGRCVQPCRRIYEQKGLKKRHFSCMDFSADVLAKVLKPVKHVTTWKIEGRKKSPHYVYYTVKAYKLLRDDPKRKKEALSYLDYALGRQFSHYNLLTQRVINPLDHSSETGSGLFVGRIKDPASPFIIAREALFQSDLLRIGFEDDKFHMVQKVTRAIPKKGKFYITKKSRIRIKKGTPVYLIDRRGSELISVIKPFAKKLEQFKKISITPDDKTLNIPVPVKKKKTSPREMHLFRGNIKKKGHFDTGIWISSRAYSTQPSNQNWLWLDPLLFPGEEKFCRAYIAKALKKGARNFVLNAVWQIALFKNPNQLNIWAGPFCNVTNSIVVNLLKEKGFKGVIVSPELNKNTLIELPRKSELPLGAVIFGNWPLGISRIISDDLKLNQPFTSPMGETAWVSKQNMNYHLFPNWTYDITSKKETLKKAGYSLFVTIHENIPKGIKMKDRPGLWNWNLKLL